MRHGRTFRGRGNVSFFLTICFVVLLPVAEAATLHVPSEYPTIAAAIGASTGGDTVQIEPGTYYEVFSVTKSISVRGSGAGETILDASGADALISLMGYAPSVEDLTIRNARVGIRILDATGVAVRNCKTEYIDECAIEVAGATECRIEENSLSASGFAGYFPGAGRSRTGILFNGVARSLVVANRIDGVRGEDGRPPHPEISITGGPGGSGYAVRSAGGVSDCTFARNLIRDTRGGHGGNGATSYSGSGGSGGWGGFAYGIHGEYVRCRFANNIITDLLGGIGGSGASGRIGGSGAGGGDAFGLRGTFRDCDVVNSTLVLVGGGRGGNGGWGQVFPGSAWSGGDAVGIRCEAGPGSRFLNCIIYNTVAGLGGVWEYGTEPPGTATGFEAESDPPIEDYNCYYGHEDGNVIGMFMGGSSFVSSPQFRRSSEPGIDLHLRAGSPCIDAGTDIPWVTRDYDGVSRPIYDGYDIGAYEFPARPPTFMSH